MRPEANEGMNETFNERYTEEENDYISMKKYIYIYKKYIVIFSESMFVWLLY